MDNTFDNSSLKPEDTPGKPRKLRMEDEKLKNALTERELDVILELKKGSSYAEIGKTLFISTETVRRHATNIYAKLDVKNRMQAINKFFEGK